MSISKQVQHLVEQGVKITAPATVHIDASVNLNRIARSATIHPGCRVHGKTTSIGPGCEIGSEAPVTLHKCQLECEVRLGGGYFNGAVMRQGVQIGASAHVRPGTVLEEHVTCGHAVGLKQTILLPFVTTGSLINFCDCLMAGGTGPSNHSEVGSSYVHFNFRPQRDKATPSLVGDVARGVMLDQPAIFLGGQGGLVGPARIEYGTVIAAGVIYRHDALKPGQLHTGRATSAKPVPYDTEVYGNIKRSLLNNFIYIGNLHALLLWHEHARALFARDQWQRACHEGAIANLKGAIAERIKQLGRMQTNLHRSLELCEARHAGELPETPYGLQQRFIAEWPALQEQLAASCDINTKDAREVILAELARMADSCTYVEAVQGLSEDARKAGRSWLQSVVDHYARQLPRATE